MISVPERSLTDRLCRQRRVRESRLWTGMTANSRLKSSPGCYPAASSEERGEAPGVGKGIVLPGDVGSIVIVLHVASAARDQQEAKGEVQPEPRQRRLAADVALVDHLGIARRDCP